MTSQQPEHSLHTLCPVCGAESTREFFALEGVPLHCNVLWESRREALAAPRGEVRLIFCITCGHVYNRSFRPDLMEYSQQYENSLHFSPFFQGYAQETAQKLVNRHQLKNKQVVEIGCGKGEFLRLLCGLGNNRGIGFDPSFSPERLTEKEDPQVTFVQDFYGRAHGNHEADLIVCRHVLEHISDPYSFLCDLRENLNGGKKTALFFEVPNALFILRDLSIWDLIYEHCSYFTPESFAAVFESAGFRVTSLESTFGEQFLTLEAFARGAGGFAPGNPERIPHEYGGFLEKFSGKFLGKVEEWNRILKEMHRAGRRVVLWGAGSKGASFLNMTAGAHMVEHVVDINPHKWGKYVAGTGQAIVSPEFLKQTPPHAIVVMNAIYLHEIQRMTGDMGLFPEFFTVS